MRSIFLVITFVMTSGCSNLGPPSGTALWIPQLLTSDQCPVDYIAYCTKRGTKWRCTCEMLDSYEISLVQTEDYDDE